MARAKKKAPAKKAPKKAAAKKPATKKATAKKPVAKKPVAKKPAAKKPAAKKPAARKTGTGTGAGRGSARTGASRGGTSRGTSPKKSAIAPTAHVVAPRFHIPTGPARQRLRDALAWVEDFVAECVRLATEEGPLPWEHADTLELVGLERWGIELAKTDREAGVCALVLAAQYGLPRVLAVGGAELDSMGFVGDEMLDGASVESQLDRCAQWVDDPSATNRDRVQDGFDPTRQLHTWDPDLKPHDTKAYFWYSEIGQLASAAVVKGDGDAGSTSYYYWPHEVCVGRGLVVAVRGLRQEGGDVATILRELYAALTA